MALCSPKEPPALPSQSLCFPSLEASGPEAQVSKVEKQFLPLQIAPVLFCFLTRLTQPWKPGLLPLGWLTGAVVALPGTQGHPSEYEPPVSSAQTFTWMGAFLRELPAPLGSASASWPSTKLQLRAAPHARGWVDSTSAESRARVRVPGLWYPDGTQPQPQHGLNPGSGGILGFFRQKQVIRIPCSPQGSMSGVTASETSPRPVQH